MRQKLIFVRLMDGLRLVIRLHNGLGFFVGRQKHQLPWHDEGVEQLMHQIKCTNLMDWCNRNI
jgi:hypothetical protein